MRSSKKCSRERLAEGELDECDLTLRDLRTIAESFKQTLRGVYHPRIAYPEPTERGAARADRPLPARAPARTQPRGRIDAAQPVARVRVGRRATHDRFVFV